MLSHFFALRADIVLGDVSMFSEKLSALMRISKITGIALSDKIGIDVTYISRLKRGKRTLPKNPEFLRPLAHTMAQIISSEGQLEVLCKEMGVSFDYLKALNTKEFEDVLFDWLDESNLEVDRNKRIVGFMEKIKNVPGNTERTLNAEIKNIKKSEFYYGNEGRKEAIIRALSETAEAKDCKVLHFFSDESYSELDYDEKFINQCSALFNMIAQNGTKIKIIHTISPNPETIFMPISSWINLYLDGMLESYSCKEKEKSYFKKTMIVAPGKFAVVSNNVKNNEDGGVYFYISEEKAVDGFVKEFESFLDNCELLVDFYDIEESGGVMERDMEFAGCEAPTILSSRTLSVMSMSQSLVKSVFKRNNLEKFTDHFVKMNESFLRLLKNNLFYDVIAIANPLEAKSGSVPISFSSVSKETKYYTKDEYIAHLKHIVYLLQSQPNYNVILLNEKESIETLYVKKDFGFMIGSDKETVFVMVSNHRAMTRTIWDYMFNKMTSGNKFSREATISHINSIINDIL